MPRDLLAEQGMTPPQGRDLLANAQQPSYSGVYKPTTTLGRIGADVTAGLGQLGHGLMAAPSRIGGSLANLGIISPETAGKIPSPAPEIDYGKAMGITKPTTADLLTQGLAHYSPYAMMSGTTLAGQALAGAAFGATQTPSPITGSVVGSVTNLGLGLVGKIAAAGFPTVAKLFSKYAAPGLAEKVGGIVDKIKNIKSADAFDRASNNYKDYQSSENNAWDVLTQHATQVDMNPNIKFNDKDYIGSLSDKLKQLKKESAQSGLARKNEDAIPLLEGYKNDPHHSFTSAILHNKALNADFQNEITPGKSVPFSTVNYAQGKFTDALAENFKNNGVNDTLGESWRNADLATKNKNSIFNEITTSAGNTVPSPFMRYYRGEKEYADPSNFIKNYIPKSSTEGTSNMQQFSNMVGDDKFAKDALKANYFDNAYDEGGFRPQKFLKKYNDLSDDQRNYLFSKADQNVASSLSKILKESPGALGAKRLLGFGIYHSLPGLAGYEIGKKYGSPWAGALIGLGAARGGEGILRAAYKSPGLQESVIKSLMASPKQRALSPLLGRALQSPITAGMAVPSTTGMIKEGQ